jgi:geranylgeranyl diphosphate synthase type I
VEIDPAAETARIVRAVDDGVRRALDEASGTLAELHPAAAALTAELRRLHDAGGRRMRGALVIWGYRAGGGAPDDPRIVAAATAVELLHLMALIHDDVMDGSPERRGVPAAHAHLAGGDEARGRSLAILAGDLAAVLADRSLDAAGFAAERLEDARRIYDAMRIEMAAGQFLDLTSTSASPSLVARLRGGGYSVEAPLALGAALAGAEVPVREALAAYGRALGIAFQLRDDVADGEAAPGTDDEVRVLLDRAAAAAGDPTFPDEVAAALGWSIGGFVG